MDAVRAGVIYRITNCVNGRVYIGCAVDFKKRVAKHKNELRTGKHHSLRLQRSWNKHGPDAFVFEIVEHVDDCVFLEARERFWIVRCRSNEPNFGYNISMMSWSRLGVTTSEETKAKIRAANLGKTRSDEVRKAISESQKGKKRGPLPPDVREKIGAAQRGIPRASLSEEHRRKIGKASTGKKYPGRKLTDEHRAAISAGLTGKKRTPFTDEHRANLAAANMGKKASPETIEKLASRMMGNQYTAGRPLSDEHRRKVSDSLKGKPKSDEHRAKLAEAQRRRWAKKVLEDAAREVNK